MTFFTQIEDYMPHGMCLLWDPWLLLLWAGSDALIVIAYFAIPLALLRVLRGRRDVPARGIVVLFASFILLCGVTHALSIVTLWVPIYPVHGLLKLLTGLVSITTAIVLFRLVPLLISLPGTRDLQEVNRQLRDEIAAHKATLDRLEEARRELEEKVAQRTADLAAANARLEVVAHEAVHRSRNLLGVVLAMAKQSARYETSFDSFAEAFVGRLDALNAATTAVIQNRGQSSADLKAVIEKQLEPVMLTYPDRVALGGPEVRIGSDAAQQISLAIHELATNAQKYGALQGESGSIEIAWHRETGETGEERLVIEWREGGATAADAAKVSTGFGTRLLDVLVPAHLGGTASRTMSGDRMLYRLDMAMTTVLADVGRSVAARATGGLSAAASPQAT